MTREGLADRFVNYADAVAAFTIVNGLAFLVALTETEVRCSIAHLTWFVSAGQIVFHLLVTGVVVALRRAELSLRSPADGTPPEVLALLRRLFVARIAIIWAGVVVMAFLSRMALSDPSCSG